MIIYFIRNQAQGKNDYEISDFKILETKLTKNCYGEQAKDYFCIENYFDDFVIYGILLILKRKIQEYYN